MWRHCPPAPGSCSARLRSGRTGGEGRVGVGCRLTPSHTWPFIDRDDVSGLRHSELPFFLPGSFPSSWRAMICAQISIGGRSLKR